MEELWRNRASIHKKMHRLFISGGSTEANTQLDEVQQWLDDHPGHDGDVNLDELTEVVQELVGIYEAEEAKGSVKSNKVLIRCQALHHAILGNLLQRITAELLKQADGRDKAKKILEVGKVLDPISSGKASMDLEEHLFSMQDKALAKYTQLMTRAEEQMKEPSTLISGAQLYVDAIAAARAEVPSSLPVAELLLRRCMQLRKLLLDLLSQASLEDSSVAIGVRHIADKLDALADSLAAAKGDVWEPRTAQKAAAHIQARAIKMLTAHLLSVRTSVAKNSKNFDLNAMVEELEAILPWWQFMSSISEVGDRLSAVHDEVDKRMVKTILDAAKAGDDPVLEVGLEATQKYDTCRANFQGAGTAAVRLRDKLSQTFSHVHEQLANLEARVNDSELGTVEHSLKSLVPLLIAAIKIDAPLLEKFSGILVAIKSKANQSIAAPSNMGRAEQMVAIGADVTRVSELMRWAERCDIICEQLPALEEALGKGYLAQSLRPRAVDVCLKATESQACRGAAIDLSAATQAMEESWNAFGSWSPVPPIDDRLVGLSLHLRRALIARMAIEPDALKALSKCAKCADGALKAGSQGRVVADLSDTVTAVWPIVQQLQRIHAELAKASGMNPKTILGSLESMKAAWQSVSEFDEFRNQAIEISSVLQQRMSASFGNALAAKSRETMDRLIQFASDFDQVFAALGIPSQLREALDATVEEHRLAEELPTLPTSSFAPPPRDSVSSTATKMLAGPEWGGDSPKRL